MAASLNLADLGRRVRAMRMAHRLTLEEVVSRTGFTVSWLSKLENGLLTPSLDGLVKLSQALECGVDELVEGLSVPPRFVFVKRGGGVIGNGKANGRIAGTHVRGVVAEALADQWRGRRMHPVILHLTGPTTQPESHPGERFLLVLQGEVKLAYGEERIVLESGDSIYIDAAIPHGLAVNGKGAARVLSVSYDAESGARQAGGRERTPRGAGVRKSRTRRTAP
jgi:mannose-6-phosphate isomerase-like protein (cupin superfamily)/DNA-binding Xre family transcriptional regulator